MKGRKNEKKKKRILALALTIIMIMSVVSAISVSAAEEYEAEWTSYKYNGTTYINQTGIRLTYKADGTISVEEGRYTGDVFFNAEASVNDDGSTTVTVTPDATWGTPAHVRVNNNNSAVRTFITNVTRAVVNALKADGGKSDYVRVVFRIQVPSAGLNISVEENAPYMNVEVGNKAKMFCFESIKNLVPVCKVQEKEL